MFEFSTHGFVYMPVLSLNVGWVPIIVLSGSFGFKIPWSLFEPSPLCGSVVEV